jgi:hypothetical protein
MLKLLTLAPRLPGPYGSRSGSVESEVTFDLDLFLWKMLLRVDALLLVLLLGPLAVGYLPSAVSVFVVSFERAA